MDGHFCEWGGDLKGSSDAQPGYLVRPKAGDILSVEDHASPIRGVDPGHQVKERRFSAAVGSDDPENRPLFHREREVVYGHHSAKGFFQFLRFQYHLSTI